MALADHYLLAYVCFGAFGLFLVCFWLTSDFVLEKKRCYIRCRIKNLHKANLSEAKRRNEIKYRCSWLGWQWGMATVWLGMCILCIAYTRAGELDHELTQLEGILYPANDPTPETECGKIPDQAILLLFGNSAAYSDGAQVNLFAVGGQPVLWVTKSDDRLLLNGTFRAPDGKELVEMSDGKFLINPHNTLPFKRPDRSTLLVKDEYGRTIVNIRYLNKRTIKLLGEYQYSPTAKFIIRDSEQIIGGLRMSHGCFGNNWVAIGVR